MAIIFSLITPALGAASDTTARDLSTYYPLFAILMLAIAINIFMLVWHRKKNKK